MEPTQDRSLLSPGMAAVLLAQFLSALADNAILIAAIAIVKAQGKGSLVPLLQESFVVPFVLLAPFVGQFADRFPKGRVMLIGNLLKLSGALGMALGLDPLFAYNLIGVGATLYSPAKYGILAQMFGAEKLVRANGMMEGSTIVAILLGVLLGGWLSDHSLNRAFLGVILCYGIAAVANLLIPRLPPENPDVVFHPMTLIKQFASSIRLLFGNPDARFSLIGTSVFWGSGTTLRLMLFAWVPVALHITDNQTPAYLMGAVSIGIVFGALIAGISITLANANRALIGGLLLGPVILLLSLISDLRLAAVAMLLVGICGGSFVVPLNALLQERGHRSIGAGNALAVQNFVENIAMLLFVGAYSLAASAGLAIDASVEGFGFLLLASMGALAWLRIGRRE
ncbi:MAG: lysophospholipid transporter LplT [Burkholderiales bacterium]|nr:lysophospholipid transporter LplT [Burkholderiales bacterium]